MSLAPGTQLGVYAILEPLGAGGMGEVYRARDTKLEREVAIKVLPEEFLRDRERLARFEREAKLLAGLNHPSIATLYGLESIDERQLLIMELVEGETLAERIARGPIPFDEAAGLFVQIAEGLGAAHDKGVVHRDLKPANIKITPNGGVKILDFGLAKALDEDDAASDEDLSQSPTRTKATAVGVILGTAPYMSPEQARGKRVDKRTDIWAFGCCLFEALTGTRVFEGGTVTDTLAAVVKNEPEWVRLPAQTTSGVRTLLERCLAKDANERMRDAWDVALHLRDDRSDQARAAAPTKSRVFVPIVVGVSLAILGTLLGWSAGRSGNGNAAPTTRLEIYLDDQELVFGGIALSPDGSSLAYTARVSQSSQIFLRHLNEYASLPVPNTDGALGPFFSPDSNWIGFFDLKQSPSTLEKVSLRGAGRTQIATGGFGGASWSDEGMIAYDSIDWEEIRSVPNGGGDPTVVIRASEERRELLTNPDLLPRGAGVLFSFVLEGASRIAVSGANGEWKILDALGEGDTPKYLPTGHLLYAQNGTLLAAPFDLSGLEVAGAPTPVVEGVASSSNRSGDRTFYAVSSSGHLAYVPGATTIQRRFVWVDRYGRETAVPMEPGPYEYPAVSPDGTRIAFTRHDRGHDSWVYHLERQTETRLTTQSGTAIAWTSDSRALALSSGVQLNQIILQSADGGPGAEILVQSSLGLYPKDWTRDGTELLYVAEAESGDRHIWVRREDGTTRRLFDERFENHLPALSSDGRLLAYVSNESGIEEVYVTPYPGLEWRRLVSRDGGREPLWSPRGDELYYRHDQQVLSVPIQRAPQFAAGAPDVLFEGDYLARARLDNNNPDYDIHPDGERFLMIRDEEPKKKIRVVLNWFDELERLVPIP